MKAIIIDDEYHNVETLSRLLNSNFPEINIEGSAGNVHDAVLLAQEYQPDLVFLDIQLRNETSFDFLNRVTPRSFEVIFVTAYHQYGIEAIKYAALDYLLKPVDASELLTAVQKVRKRALEKQRVSQVDFLINQLKNADRGFQRIALPLFTETRYVELGDIMHCEAQNSYVLFYLNNNEKILVSRPLKEYDELLSPRGFIRCHQTHLVNPKYIKSLLKEDGASLLLRNNTRIPVSKSKREFVKRSLAG
ncbi:LytTR family DNA-binding domain-containing protein [Niabella yanshanensis]|uniref:LytTR family DNA-binding domain-containing protein n=1 Tax=Niabella yanshanensis TaxID=577386 RepID=A0ABZ0W3F2_9BACT|nr:LytTR family DNA-binding domain-containing protein [Niabella yanshanensis]WQD37788.1 LytTR family DNA-binding domain-containing protein [Niabella yanshanensis]